MIATTRTCPDCGHPLEDVPFPMAAWRPGFPPTYVGLVYHWRRMCPKCTSDRRA